MVEQGQEPAKLRDGDREIWLAVCALDGGVNRTNDNVVNERYTSG